MALWDFLVRRVVIESEPRADSAAPDRFQVEVEDGYEPLEVHHEQPLASGLPGGHEYEVVFAERS